MTTAASQFCGPCRRWRWVIEVSRFYSREITPSAASTNLIIKTSVTIILACGHTIVEVSP